jgi:predicted Rossmann-fold nucleotide-binding protein
VTDRYVDRIDALLELAPKLSGVVAFRLDLRTAAVDWTALELDDTCFLACALPDGVAGSLTARGATVLPDLPALPFTPYRSTLYSSHELLGGVDAEISAWFRRQPRGLADSLAQGIHDASIETSLSRLLRVELAGRSVVGVMGSHATRRDDPLFREIARLGRLLARAGAVVVTGGGPGVMEAANLGAWLAPLDDSALDAALDDLRAVPAYDDREAYVALGATVQARYPGGGVNLGVPTWVYDEEPTSPFTTHVAKFFANSVRENGLLAIALAGVVYAPGGAGTEQEIFTDAAQNTYTAYDVRSPMVFFGRDHYERVRPDLVPAVRSQAEAAGWSGCVELCDTAEEVVEFLQRTSLRKEQSVPRVIAPIRHRAGRRSAGGATPGVEPSPEP